MTKNMNYTDVPVRSQASRETTEGSELVVAEFDEKSDRIKTAKNQRLMDQLFWFLPLTVVAVLLLLGAYCLIRFIF